MDLGLRVRLWIRASNLHAFGDEGILGRPSVHRAAIGALGKCNSVGQLIDVCQIDIDARGDEPFCSWALEQQFRQWSLHQSPAKKGGAYAIRDQGSAAATVNALQFEIHVAQTTVFASVCQTAPNSLPRFKILALYSPSKQNWSAAQNPVLIVIAKTTIAFIVQALPACNAERDNFV
jgi:hypothetical protein